MQARPLPSSAMRFTSIPRWPRPCRAQLAKGQSSQLMEKRTLGKTGMNVTVLGYGGAEIGFRYVPVETVDQLIISALDAGLNVIDTAECYIASEEMIGKTVAHRRNE